MGPSNSSKPVKASFKCKTKDLRDTLKFLNPTRSKKTSNLRRTLEITIKTNEVIFTVAGSSMTMFCEAYGPGKFTLSLFYLTDMAQTCYNRTSVISIGDWFMTYNDHTVDVETCYFEDDTILRSIKLPLNYKINDILKLPHKYTPEEIKFNKLEGEYDTAISKLANDAKIIKQRLKKYGISPLEIDRFLHDKIFEDKSGTNDSDATIID